MILPQCVWISGLVVNCKVLFMEILFKKHFWHCSVSGYLSLQIISSGKGRQGASHLICHSESERIEIIAAKSWCTLIQHSNTLIEQSSSFTSCFPRLLWIILYFRVRTKPKDLHSNIRSFSVRNISSHLYFSFIYHEPQ